MGKQYYDSRQKFKNAANRYNNIHGCKSDGWGAVCEKSETGGMWIKQEQALHINALELLGAKVALFSFFKDNKYIKQIGIMMDNTTAVAYINSMGGIRSDLCDDIAFDIWQWAAE